MNESTLRESVNPAISKIIPYQPGKPIEELARETGLKDIIKLASNENPLGASASVRKVIEYALHQLALYPDGGCYELKLALSQFYQLPAEYFTIGNGSENSLEIIAKTFLLPQDEVVISQYTFATIPLILQSFSAHTVVVPTRNWQLDVDAMCRAIHARTKMVFIVNPNNPTGTYVNRIALERLLKHISPKTIVVVDEAYNEYIDAEDYSDALPYLANYPNLIITRTFSKVYGLAGLRIGYTISHPAIADMLNRARLPFNVNALGAIAAKAALSDQEHVMKSKCVNTEGKQQLIRELNQLNLSYIPSVGNFVAVYFGQQALSTYQALLKQGIIVRPLVSYGMNDYLRITIGTRAEITRLLQALKNV